MTSSRWTPPVPRVSPPPPGGITPARQSDRILRQEPPALGLVPARPHVVEVDLRPEPQRPLEARAIGVRERSQVAPPRGLPPRRIAVGPLDRLRPIGERDDVAEAVGMGVVLRASDEQGMEL